MDVVEREAVQDRVGRRPLPGLDEAQDLWARRGTEQRSGVSSTLAAPLPHCACALQGYLRRYALVCVQHSLGLPGGARGVDDEAAVGV